VKPARFLVASLASLALIEALNAAQGVGSEVALPQRLAPGGEFALSLEKLVAHGKNVFSARFTVQEGQGRRMTKGTGDPLADPSDPLDFPRNMNRVSGPESNSCVGCHNVPILGGAGEFVSNAWVMGQRFDYADFDDLDATPTDGSMDETGVPVELDTIGNSRQSLGLFGSGFIEMLARQITSDLQAIRDSIGPGESDRLRSKGISYGVLARDAAGNWDTSLVEGLAPPSLASSGPNDPPNLIIRPFHQASAVVSLREFANGAMNHHMGIQSVERFGAGVDADQDGFVDELATPEISALVAFATSLNVPGRVIPDDPALRQAIRNGEHTFVSIGCAACHVPSLPLDDEGWKLTEPNPFNPPGNLRTGDAYVLQHGQLEVDLTDDVLPGPRPKAHSGVVAVAAFTDFKLHDISAGPNDPNREPLDMHATPGSPDFFAGNSRFLTAKLWGAADQMPYYHHGRFTTMRQAVEAHAGEAAGVMSNWSALNENERLEVMEFLKSLRLPNERSVSLVVDPRGRAVAWPAFPWQTGQNVPQLP
jgi:hypothetical protein